MNKKITAVSILAVLCLACCLQADSIWAKKEKKQKNLYADDKARGIGDVLTIFISEESTIDNKATRTLSKTTKRDANFDGQIGIEHIITDVPAVKFGTGSQYTNTLDGKADYKDEREFTDSISVVVVDVMPNKNLVVYGTRERNIAGDIQLIEVSGIVRPNDIAFGNTVFSEQVANFSIVSENKGISAPYTKPNWLGRILDVIWPF